eukprot:scaffold310_cov168-Amphora_coffeaeformis.AAC.24
MTQSCAPVAHSLGTILSANLAGTLTADQVEILRTGFEAITCSPQSVGIIDNCRLPKHIDPETTAPVIFYINDAISSCDNATEEGTTVFHVINSGSRPLFQPSPLTLKRIMECSAVKIKDILVARTFESGEEHQLDYLAFQQERQATRRFGRGNFVIGNSLRETLNRLEESGLDRACVPLALGGDIFYSKHFHEWIRERLSIEGSMISAPPVRNTRTANVVVTNAIQKLLPNARPKDLHKQTRTDNSAALSRGSAMLVERRPGES